VPALSLVLFTILEKLYLVTTDLPFAFFVTCFLPVNGSMTVEKTFFYFKALSQMNPRHFGL